MEYQTTLWFLLNNKLSQRRTLDLRFYLASIYAMFFFEIKPINI